MIKQIRVGTRGSMMALFQADSVVEMFRRRFPDCEISKCVISTEADLHEESLHHFGGKGAFIRALDSALLNGKIDVAVNCLKDIPNSTERSSQICIAGVLPRGELRDVAICRDGLKLNELPQGSKIGTVAPRRIAQLRRYFPLLTCVHFRGSADSRIAKLDAGVVDGIVLASSGLNRIGMRHRSTEDLSTDDFVPALGAGIITMDCHSERGDLRTVIAELSDPVTYRCMIAERAFVDSIGGSCHTAMAGYAECDKDDSLFLRVVVYSPDGSDLLELHGQCRRDGEEELGVQLALLIKAKARISPRIWESLN